MRGSTTVAIAGFRPVTVTLILGYQIHWIAELDVSLQSLQSQSRPPDEIIVIDNASSDRTGDVARQVTGVRVVDEPRKGLVVAGLLVTRA